MPYTGKTVSYGMGGMTNRRVQAYNPLDGTSEMIEKTYATPLHQTSSLTFFNGFNEMASWVRFIDALHSNAAETRMLASSTKQTGVEHEEAHLEGASLMISKESMLRYEEAWNYYMIPTVTSQQHSWDFVPPDVIRPLAIATLQDIAIFSRRLSMRWKTFEPSEGILRAEGNGHTVDSTAVRSVGVVLQFSIRDPLRYPRSFEELYIPTEPADKMGFGILPGDPRLSIPDHAIGTPADCLARTHEIDVQASDTLKNCMNENGWTPGFSDIIGLAAPMIRLLGSAIIKLPRPAVYEAGLTLQQEGIVVFHNRLRDLIKERELEGGSISQQTTWVLRQLDELSDYGQYWLNEKSCRGNQTPIQFLDDLHKRHDMTTEYFVSLNKTTRSENTEYQVFRYTDLMYSHIKHAVDYVSTAIEILKAGKARNHYGQKVRDRIAEGAHVYFDMIPKIIDTMKQKGCDNAPLVEEAWFTMMLRAFLWHRTHSMVEGKTLSSQHWGSRLPVYIG